MNLEELKHRLNHQDNRMTAYPLFIAQGLRRYVGINSDCESNLCYINFDSSDIYYPDRDKEEWAKYHALDEAGKLPSHIESQGFFDYWEMIQPFLTEVAANKYLEDQAHNLMNYFRTRVYVQSGQNNAEMRAIIDYFSK